MAPPINIKGLIGIRISGYLQGLGLPQLSAQNIYLIPAPILASSPELALAFKVEPGIAELLAMTQLAQVALVGSGATDEQATLVNSGYVSASELTLFRRMGAVGDVLGHFYNAEGKMLDIAPHQHIIGISLLQLATIPIRIGASGGVSKVAATLSALAGRHINVLITDEQTATLLLRNPA